MGLTVREQFIKITIDKSGKVSFTVEGVKGESCIAETKFLEEALGGKVADRELLPEYYTGGVAATNTQKTGR